MAMIVTKDLVNLTIVMGQSERLFVVNMVNLRWMFLRIDRVILNLRYFQNARKTLINAIESLISCYRRLNKQRSIFPSFRALMKALYLGTFEIAKKWTMPIRNWGKVRGELELMYPERMSI